MERLHGNDGQQGVGTPALTTDALTHIEACLKEVGDHGEVHLVVNRGRIRFIRSVKSVNLRSGSPNGANVGE